MTLLSGLAPICGSDSRILILGSFPSVRSLEKGEYYGHERNHFWPLAAKALGFAAPPERYEDRVLMLQAAKIAVWDLFAACERQGSLDKDIRSAQPNPLAAFVAAHTGLVRVALNGGASAAGFLRLFSAELRPMGSGSSFGSGSDPSPGLNRSRSLNQANLHAHGFLGRVGEAALWCPGGPAVAGPGASGGDNITGGAPCGVDKIADAPCGANSITGAARSIEVLRLPSTSPVPTAAYRNVSDKEELWTAFLRLTAESRSMTR